MSKEKDPLPRNNQNQNPEGCRTEETILGNLLEALKETGGWNEELLHQTVKSLLGKEEKNDIFLGNKAS